MTLHIFNPDHDIALAANLSNFTPPHAGRYLRFHLGFLPALWAKADDLVLVEQRDVALQAFRKLNTAVTRMGMTHQPLSACQFVEPRQLPAFHGIDDVEPWGWDLALRDRLKRYGVAESLLLSDGQLEEVRSDSHRRLASRLLPLLRVGDTVGASFECSDADSILAFLHGYGRIVLKAPWSSSGRGIRFWDNSVALTDNQKGWMHNVLKTQGSIMVEPYYNKVKDFGMEFESRDGRVSYCGLSLFDTANGAYTGNILATETAKLHYLERYVPQSLLLSVIRLAEQHLTTFLGLHYTGPLGIDMMIVADESQKGFLLHPCVEVNLRRTMGHVALSLSQHCNPQADDEWQGVMRVANGQIILTH